MSDEPLGPKPAICRMVIYHTEGGDYPAVITKVHSDTLVNLNIFHDTGGLVVRTSIALGAGIGQWSWPPRG